MNFLKYVLDFIFPPICGICNQLGEGFLCKNCEKELQNYLYKNEKQEKEDERFHLLKYEELIRNKIITYKFEDKNYLCHLFSTLILHQKEACTFLKQYDMILPIPIHAKRKRERGYNQSELVAKEVAKALNIQIQNDILLKQKNTKPQSSLKREDRLKNVQGVYKIKNRNKIQEKSIVIFDDIYTTGATTKQCRKMLKEAGAKRVGIFTIAKD